ncbi:hydrogenase nickel incorporation protein HypA [Lachnoclostridium sp. An169]|uniref:hydrogenase maturation nickel metallochaperone HypA n=1 Tax=Lachnoclostridium sp. An169 TaxID=1965569 RepID=UPI000B373F62|nr:hydrogenase nickel incorporation protein HypA [Lachnoclostridium sp. An169]
MSCNPVLITIKSCINRISEAENHLTSVASVTLEIGEVSDIVPDYITDCWNWAVKKTNYLKDAELRIERIEAVTYCENCGKTYPTVQYAKICPYCKSDHTYLLSGNEYNIREIEAC